MTLLVKIFKCKGWITVFFVCAVFILDAAEKIGSQKEAFQELLPMEYEVLAKPNLRINGYAYNDAAVKSGKELVLNNLNGIVLPLNQRWKQQQRGIEILLLQRITLLGTILFLMIIGVIYVNNIRNKHKIENRFVHLNTEVADQRSKDLLELKNKELMALSLQLLEKERILEELKNKLKAEGGNLKSSEMATIFRSISNVNTNKWEEFKHRFTAVNDKFYKELTSKWPDLSQNDLRICALVKLNFTSQDMADLLGISAQSVHTTRYRVRKKIGLPRSVNLEEFIANL